MLAQPETTDHKCSDDQFIVSGGAPVPAICGTSTGAHSKSSLNSGLYFEHSYKILRSWKVKTKLQLQPNRLGWPLIGQLSLLFHYISVLLVYIDMGLSTNSPVVITVVSSGQSFSRSFSVKVTQIECTSLAKCEG